VFVVYLTTLFSYSDYAAFNERVEVDDGTERIWKEAAVVQLKVLSQHSPGGIEEKYKNPRSE
jgi:hypothetical protein